MLHRAVTSLNQCDIIDVVMPESTTTQLHAFQTDDARLRPPVDVEVGLVAVQALTYLVGQPANGKNVFGPIQGECVIGAEALRGEYLVGNRTEPCVVCLESV